MSSPPQDLLNTHLRVIAMGVGMFAEALGEQGVGVIQVDWRPPAEEAEQAYDLLPMLED
jgi:hypothetical protein